MFNYKIPFSHNEYLELQSRIMTNEEKLALSIRGQKNKNEITISSVYLNEKEVKELIGTLKSWLNSEKQI